MSLTKTDVKIIATFLIFVVVGIWGSLVYHFVEETTARSVRKFAIPSFIIAAIMSYYTNIVRGPKQDLWRTVVGLILFTIVISFVFIRSFQGYLLLWNCNVGKQKEVITKGIVTSLNYPKVKKPLNQYAVELTLDNNSKIVQLIVPNNTYKIGDTFEAEMKKGSLDILYSY